MNKCNDCYDYELGMGGGQCPRCKAQDKAESAARTFDYELEQATHIIGEAIHGPSKTKWALATPLHIARTAANVIASRNETIAKLEAQIEELKAQLEIQNFW